jgi:hypothetical protein
MAGVETSACSPKDFLDAFGRAACHHFDVGARRCGERLILELATPSLAHEDASSGNQIRPLPSHVYVGLGPARFRGLSKGNADAVIELTLRGDGRYERENGWRDANVEKPDVLLSPAA